jgi:sporulation integral membrane protein YtvI
MADRAPDGVRPLAQRTVLELFDDGTALVNQFTGSLPGAVKNLLSGVGNSLLSVGTGILSAFLISVRLPRLQAAAKESLPESWNKRYLPALQKLRKSLLGWLKAQGKLALVTWGVVSLGFFVLRIPYGPMWAMLVALVDAVPVLGTGIVLIPWAAVSFLQGSTLQGVGLLCTYGAAVITRTVLEPRLMGRQLGLDPLLTLVALYAGFRLWGIPGLLLTPILASAAKSIAKS